CSGGVARSETVRRETRPATRLAADERRAAEARERLRMLACELVPEADRLGADLVPVARDARRVPPVRERRLVEGDPLEADRDAEHEVQVVEDLEARVERTRRVERAAREAHPLELPEVPAKDLRDAERTACERARDARLDPRLLAAGGLVLRREHPPVLD